MMIDPTLRQAFEDIYASDRWTNGSGPGSSPASTIEYRAFVERFIQENGVRSVTDLGCGDWQFSKLLDWSNVHYIGLDIVKSVIDTNIERYQSERTIFKLMNDIEDLPGGDLLICKEMLQHLPNDVVLEYVEIIGQRYRFALITNAIEPLAIVNKEIVAGDWRPLRLGSEPFNIPGAVVSVYFPQSGSHFWRNGVFLMMGRGA